MESKPLYLINLLFMYKYNTIGQATVICTVSFNYA